MYTLATLFPLVDFQSGLMGTFVAFLMYFGLSLGLFIMAKSMKLKSAWLAWFPILRIYLVGKAVDFIQAKNGKKSSHGAKLLLVRIFKQLSIWLPPVLSVGLVIAILLPLVCGGALAYFYTTGDFGVEMIDESTVMIALFSTGYQLPKLLVIIVAAILAVLLVAIPVVLFVLLTLISIVAPYLAIAFTIYYHTALYYCFAALKKNHAPLYTVLSVLFDFGAPLFLFLASIGGLDKAWVTEKEETPAEVEAPAETVETEVEAPAETAETEAEAPAAE